MFCGARFFNQPLNQLPRLRATPGGSGAVTARLALTGTLITGNLPIITPRRGSGVNNPVNNPTGFRLNPFSEISEDPSGRYWYLKSRNNKIAKIQISRNFDAAKFEWKVSKVNSGFIKTYSTELTKEYNEFLNQLKHRYPS